MSHVHREIEGLRVRKAHRLVIRFAVAIILCCLPLAHNLNSLELISVMTGLIVFVLIAEIWGSSCMFESFFDRNKACRYTTECQMKKNLEDAIKMGGIVKIEDLESDTEKGKEIGLYD